MVPFFWPTLYLAAKALEFAPGPGADTSCEAQNVLESYSSIFLILPHD